MPEEKKDTKKKKKVSFADEENIKKMLAESKPAENGVCQKSGLSMIFENKTPEEVEENDVVNRQLYMNSKERIPEKNVIKTDDGLVHPRPIRLKPGTPQHSKFLESVNPKGTKSIAP